MTKSNHLAFGIFEPSGVFGMKVWAGDEGGVRLGTCHCASGRRCRLLYRIELLIGIVIKGMHILPRYVGREPEEMQEND